MVPFCHAQYGSAPEQIANAPCELKLPSFKTVYRWIYEKYLVRGNVKVLRRKGKTRKRMGRAAGLPHAKAYAREIEAYIRATNSDIGKQTLWYPAETKACFATLAERTTRYYIAVKIPDRTGESMARAIIKVLSVFPSDAVKTITYDKGSEFACWRKIEKELHCDVYLVCCSFSFM